MTEKLRLSQIEYDDEKARANLQCALGAGFPFSKFKNLHGGLRKSVVEIVEERMKQSERWLMGDPAPSSFGSGITYGMVFPKRKK